MAALTLTRPSSKSYREAVETVRGQLRLREGEVEVLRRELRDRPTVISDSRTPKAQTPQLVVDQTQEVQDLTAKVRETRMIRNNDNLGNI
jgi:hypothetical protein